MWSLLKRSAVQKWRSDGDSFQTQLAADDVFSNFFDENHKVDTACILKIANKCRYPGKLMQVEDIDGYTIIHKLVIFNCNDLLNDLITNNKLSICKQVQPLHSVLDCPLHIACALGNISCIKTLLKYGYNIAQLGKLSLKKPKCPSETCLPELYKQQTKAMQQYQRDREPLYFAVCYNQYKVIDFYKSLSCLTATPTPSTEEAATAESMTSEHSSSLPQHDISWAKDLLHIACYMGHVESFTALYNVYPPQILNQDCPDQYGDGFIYRQTPVCLSLRHGPVLFDAMFNRCGADVALLHINYALHMFLWNLSSNPQSIHLTAVAMLTRLLDKGLDVNIFDRSGQTPLHVLIGCINYSPVLEHDATELVKDSSSDYDWLHAYDSAVVELLDVLLSRGADANIRDNHGDSMVTKLLRNDRYLLRYELLSKMPDDIPANIQECLFTREVYGLQTINTILGVLQKNGTVIDEQDEQHLISEVVTQLVVFVQKEPNNVEFLLTSEVFTVILSIIRQIIYITVNNDVISTSIINSIFQMQKIFVKTTECSSSISSFCTTFMEDSLTMAVKHFDDGTTCLLKIVQLILLTSNHYCCAVSDIRLAKKLHQECITKRNTGQPITLETSEMPKHTIPCASIACRAIWVSNLEVLFTILTQNKPILFHIEGDVYNKVFKCLFILSIHGLMHNYSNVTANILCKIVSVILIKKDLVLLSDTLTTYFVCYKGNAVYTMLENLHASHRN